MPRKPRQKSKTGIYHVIVRGINRQAIFHEEEDYNKYLATIKQLSLESGIKVLGYCLMTNHVHLLLMEDDTEISVFMKRLGVSYAYWYNWKYERNGHVFQDRFKSELVEDDAYLLTVIRYIHRNPVQASIVSKPEEYKWSSCATYFKTDTQTTHCPDCALILGILAEEKKAAIELFHTFMEESNEDQCLDYYENKRICDREAYEITTNLLNGRPVTVLQMMDQEERNQILIRLKNEYSLSLRQISRISGLPFHIVRK